MSFIQTYWYLILALVVSGGLLVWPLVARRLSPVKDIGTLEATRLMNSANALMRTSARRQTPKGSFKKSE